MISTLQKRLAERWKFGVLGSGLCLLATLLSGVKPMGPWLRELGHDLLIRIQGHLTVGGVTVIAMDEASYSALQQKPGALWDRHLHADVIRQALALGARAVVFDVWFAEPGPDPSADRRLIEAIAAAPGQIVLAAKLQESVHGGTNLPTIASEPLPPAPAFAAVAPWGVVDLPVDPDGRVRRHYTNANYSGLAWKLAETLGIAPERPLAARWINFYGPLPRNSYREVLEGTRALPPGYFANRVVFIGQYPVSTPYGDDFRDVIDTAGSRWRGQGTPGVEAQATIFLNLIRGDWLTRLPRGGETLLLFASALILGFGLALPRPWVAAWMAPVSGLIVAGLAIVALSGFRMSLPWLTVNAVQIPCAFLWCVIAQSKGLAREKAELQRQLATAIQAASNAAIVRPLRNPEVIDCSLIRCVGSGAYGDVWLARDLVGNFRAVKAIYRDRFPRIEPYERELRGIEKFSPISRTHPGWVDILHIGRLGPEEGFYYIMEAGDDQVMGARIDPDTYVPRTLAGDLRRRRKLLLPECVTVSLALADALEHLHRHGLIHRDIKPSNVIFVNGEPKFADIGLVTDISSTQHDVSFLGTEGYIAPEGPGSPTADVFSLGKLIYEAATGRDRRAFPELPTSLEQGISDPDLEELYRIALKACEFELRHRYASAAELKADLERLHERLSAGA